MDLYTEELRTICDTAQGSSLEPGADNELLLCADDVSLRFGGIKALTGVAFSARRGELFSIIGPNGAGKTSLLNCLSGRYMPTSGRVAFDGRDITRLAPRRR